MDDGANSSTRHGRIGIRRPRWWRAKGSMEGRGRPGHRRHAMKILKKMIAAVGTVVLMVPATLLAQELPGRILFSTGELEQIAAPVALYPDPLLAQVLMAATYPAEVVQAARFVQANPTLRDSQLDEALRNQNWDDSVKGSVLFPQ